MDIFQVLTIFYSLFSIVWLYFAFLCFLVCVCLCVCIWFLFLFFSLFSLNWCLGPLPLLVSLSNFFNSSLHSNIITLFLFLSSFSKYINSTSQVFDLPCSVLSPALLYSPALTLNSPHPNLLAFPQSPVLPYLLSTLCKPIYRLQLPHSFAQSQSKFPPISHPAPTNIIL